jgi:hypothetical protein
MNGFYMMDRNFLRRIAADSKLSSGEARILVAIMSMSKMPGDTVDAGAACLIGATGMTKRNIIRNRKKLIGRGYLVVEGAGKRNVGMYRLTDSSATGDTRDPCDMYATGDTRDPCTGDTRDPCRLVNTLFKKQRDSGPAIPQAGPSEARKPIPRAPKKSRTKNPKIVEGSTWQVWVAANRSAGRKDPAPSSGALQAAKDLASWVPDIEEQRQILDAYLLLDDPWIKRQGYQLSLLTKYRFEAARQLANEIRESPDDLNDPRAIKFALECIEEERALLKAQQEKEATE